MAQASEVKKKSTSHDPYPTVTDILEAEDSLPINFDKSGKMSLSKTAESETEEDFENEGGRDKTLNFNRSVFQSMPDLSQNIQSPETSLLTTGGKAIDGGFGFGRSLFGNRGTNARGENASNPLLTSTTSLNLPGGGRVTPIGLIPSMVNRRHTLKDYEKALDDLQRENFNLKIRIWDLERRLELRRDGDGGEENAKRMSKEDLESQLAELKFKLDEKERMLKESLDLISQLKASRQRELTTVKREYEIEVDVQRRQFSERAEAMERLLRQQSEQLEQLQHENLRLDQKLNGRQSTGESDSDVSLMSTRDREMVDMRTRLAVLERERQMYLSGGKMPPGEFDADLDEIFGPSKDNVTKESAEETTVNYGFDELEALKDELEQKSGQIEQMRTELDDRSEEIARLRSMMINLEKRTEKSEKDADDREQDVVNLESMMTDKNRVIADLESKVDGYKKRLDVMERKNKSVQLVNNSDDEKLRQMEEELHAARAESLKQAKMIQGLLKRLHKYGDEATPMNDRRVGTARPTTSAAAQPGASFGLLTPPNDVDENHFDADRMPNETSGGRNSTYGAWMNETSGDHMRRQELQMRQHDDLIRRRVAEFHTVSETVADRLTRVADRLEDYAVHMAPNGENSSHMITGISNELSMLRRTLQQSMANASNSIAGAFDRSGAAGGADVDESLFAQSGHRGPDGDNKSIVDGSFNESQLINRSMNAGGGGACLNRDPFGMDLSNLSRLSERQQNHGDVSFDQHHGLPPPKSIYQPSSVVDRRFLPPPMIDEIAQTDALSMINAAIQTRRPTLVNVGTSTAAHRDASNNDNSAARARSTEDLIRRRYEHDMDQLRHDFEHRYGELSDKYERLERYSKRLKSDYRKLIGSTVEMETYVDGLLVQEKQKMDDLDQVVCRLEQNNEILAGTLEAHEIRDQKLKEKVRAEAANVKELKTRLKKMDVRKE